jgi:ATP-dependent DNA helicase RecG
LSTNLDGLSTNPSGLSTNLGVLSTKLTAEEESRRKALLDELPGALAAKIGAIGQRHPPGEVCNAIMEVCKLRDWRADELAALVRRNPRYVRNNYLRPLMRDGRLTMTNPDEPNDPQQAYRTIEEAN